MIHVFETVPQVMDATARFVVRIAEESMRERGRFVIALSGGTTPRSLYELLASDFFKGKIEWEKVYFFFGDERYVPQDDPQRNSLMVRKALFLPLAIAKTQIFEVNATLPPEEAAEDYEKRLFSFFGSNSPVFDLILLGLGDNAHTASLFPYTSVLEERAPGVRSVFLKDQESYRITMTAPLINHARYIAFLVHGISKAEAVQHVLEAPGGPQQYPGQLIKPETGEIHWFMDEAAGVRIRKDS